jgi:hypothetical protein
MDEEEQLPLGLNCARNGLFLCTECHTHFDSNVKLTTGSMHHGIEILGDGKIKLYGELKG